MKPDKPMLFLGSSQEARDNKIVDTFIDVLGDCAHCIPWWLDPQFKEEGSRTTFEALCAAATAYDFAVFLFTNDDVLQHRKSAYAAPRDNVVFELGLFIGAIGADRVMGFIRVNYNQQDKFPLKIPSDFSGVGMPPFEHDGSIKSVASVQKSCTGFCTYIKKEGFRPINLVLTRTWSFCQRKREFVVSLCPARLTRSRLTIRDHRVCLAARIENPDVNIEDDENLVYSNLRTLPLVINAEIPLRIAETDLKGIEAGATIQGRILLVPKSLGFDPSQPLSIAQKAGCKDVETLSFQLGRDFKSAP